MRLIRTLIATDRNGNLTRPGAPDGRPGPDLRLQGVVGGDGTPRRLQLLLQAQRRPAPRPRPHPGPPRPRPHRAQLARGAQADLVLAQPGESTMRASPVAGRRSRSRLAASALGWRPPALASAADAQHQARPGALRDDRRRQVRRHPRLPRREDRPPAARRHPLARSAATRSSSPTATRPTTSTRPTASTRSASRSTSSRTRPRAGPGTTSTGSPAGPSRARTSPRAPFRWVGYDGDANHGRGHHLHLSWNHSETKPGPPGARPSTRSAAPAPGSSPSRRPAARTRVTEAAGSGGPGGGGGSGWAVPAQGRRGRFRHGRRRQRRRRLGGQRRRIRRHRRYGRLGRRHRRHRRQAPTLRAGDRDRRRRQPRLDDEPHVFRPEQAKRAA